MIVNIALIAAIIIITPHRILQAFADMSGWLRSKGFLGMFICYLLVGEHDCNFSGSRKLRDVGFRLMQCWHHIHLYSASPAA